jgi:hypothetical protein
MATLLCRMDVNMFALNGEIIWAMIIFSK